MLIVAAFGRDGAEDPPKRISLEPDLTVLTRKTLPRFVKLQTRKASGIEYNRAEQLHRLAALREQLSLKRQLLTKYQSLQTLDGPAASSAH
ncbi:hypothetical protein FJT64_000599 [Amphibalanus amphitrite]|uniref:Mediator of RNA polymerase II transcription subunit 9 n=1 Tax=Amphibalanus amphitrite TaxID=1232801 RepID=A0A6A4VGM0_AMPAM|nr:hypothetical protein FJT64_000599 [Amphibalanus amphitrite]